MRSLISIQDSMGRPTLVVQPPDTAMAVRLTAGVARTVTVPASARIALFNATGNVWIRIGGAAVLPVADILDGSAPELNPVAREVKPGQTVGLVAAQDCIVNLVYFG